MHKTLIRQVHHVLGEEASIPTELHELFESISVTYDDFDKDRKLIERSLEISSLESKQLISLLQATLDSTNEGILVVDANNKIVNHNKQLLEILGITESIILTRSVDVVIDFLLGSMVDSEIFTKSIKTTFSGLNTQSSFTIQLRNGKSVEMNAKSQRLNGENVGLVLSFRDITSLLKAENELRVKNIDLEHSQLATVNLLKDLEKEKRAVEQKVIDRTAEIEREKNKLLQVTQNMKGGGIMLDPTQHVVFINEFALTTLGCESLENPSENILEAFFEYFSQGAVREHLARCISGETFKVDEVEGGGKLYEVFFHFLQNTHETGSETVGYFVLFFDITDAKLLERSKSELVAVASHQLRTPLTAMRGNVEMLVDESFGSLNKEQHELLNDVEVSTIRLITMVNEMLDITKIEKGDMEMTIESINVKEVLDSVARDLENYSKLHEFEIELSGVQTDRNVMGDKLRVRQIFQNLIDNAIKYSSHPGKLSIKTSVTSGMLEVVFQDNGIGVPQNEQSKLFGRFYRASNTAKTASSGSGLGLYIVKSIAKQLNGDIRFESEEGKGTTFFVTLPIDNKNSHE